MMRSNLSPKNESLIYAAADGDLQQVKKLLEEKGCNVNACDQYGLSAALYAAKRNDLEMLKLLVKAGAFVEVEDKVGQDCILWAQYNKNQEMIDFINSSNGNKKILKIGPSK